MELKASATRLRKRSETRWFLTLVSPSTDRG